MQLSKVIVMSMSAAAVTAAATTIGVSLFLNAFAADSSANSYTTTPQESESLIADAGTYNTSGTVLTASPNNDKSAAEQHSIATEPESNKVNSVLPESIVPSTTSDKGTDALNTNVTVAENKSVHTTNGNTEDNNNSPAAEDNNLAKTTADTNKADASAPANNATSNSTTLGNPVVSSPASVVSNTDSSNKPAPVTPNSSPANAVSNTDSANKPAPATPNSSPTSAVSNTGSNNKPAPVTPNNSPASAVPNTNSANKPTPATPDSNPANVASDTNNSDKSAPVTPDSTPANVVADTDSSNESAPTTNTVSRPTYDHTTSIYTDDWNTLLRVEYYDDNNKLFEYSSVTDYDKDTNSYTETVYRWDDEKDEEVTMRTDTYVNGELVSSESP